MTIRSIFIALIAIFTVVAGPAGASAQKWLATFNFQCLSGGQCNSGNDKLNLMITNLGPYSDYDVRFTFLNSWDSNNIDSIITGITFIDNPASPTILDYSKSAISIGTDDVDFSPVDSDYATDFSSSTLEKGLNPGESVSLRYAFTDAGDDIFDLVAAIGDSSLSIQLNVQMIGSQGSSSPLFLLNSTGEGPVPIPEPATMLLLGTGLVGIAAATRKRFNITP
jgi:hypothetical protein